MVGPCCGQSTRGRAQNRAQNDALAAAVWTVLLATFSLIGGLFALLIPQVLSEVDEMGTAVRQGFDDVTAASIGAYAKSQQAS